MLPKSSSPLSELSTPPNLNPSLQKSKSSRKQKCRDKENSDPSSDIVSSGKPSPATKMKSPLPPRPPPLMNSSNPLKRKLSNDAVSDIVVGGLSSSASDTGVKV